MLASLIKYYHPIAVAIYTKMTETQKKHRLSVNSSYFGLVIWQLYRLNLHLHQFYILHSTVDVVNIYICNIFYI